MHQHILFDSIYTKANRQKDKSVRGEEPNKIIVENLKLFKGKSVLDLGVGEGKDAIFLAQKGYKVLGIDCSKIGIERFKKKIKEQKVKIPVQQKFIENFVREKQYDNIISMMTLHFIKRKYIKTIIKNMKAHTNPGGLNIIKVFSVDDPSYKKHPRKRTYFKHNELKEYYKDRNIIYYKEYMTKPEKHTKDDVWHRHGIARIVAIKK